MGDKLMLSKKVQATICINFILVGIIIIVILMNVNSLKKELKEVLNINVGLNQEIKILKSNISKLNVEISNLELTNDDLAEQLLDIESENKQLQSTISGLEKKNKELNLTNKELNKKSTPTRGGTRIVSNDSKKSTNTNTQVTPSTTGKRLLGTFQASAYTDDVGSQGKWVGQTASGMKPQVGVVAVDTKVIPLGTKLYIEGYGNAIAGDTGGAIKGNRVDLFMNTKSECMNFGRRNVKIWIRE